MLYRTWRDDDFEDEVCFKRGRVVTPRLPDIIFAVLIIKIFGSIDLSVLFVSLL